jgi:predicted phage terminase large subunit-like protein
VEKNNLNTLRERLFEQAILKSKGDFLVFVKLIAPTLISDFRIGRHIELLARKLQLVEQGKIKRLMVFLPPRSTKSVICSKLFPAWYMGRHPNHEILSISHSDQLAADFGRSVRDIVNNDLYKAMFPGTTLRSDVRAAGKWQTNQNGVYIAAGVRSQIAGRGCHIALLDDVMSEEDAFSEAGRRYVKEWYPAGLRTRLMPNGSIVIINTRYHEDDLCGWLLNMEKKQQKEALLDTELELDSWDVIRIPAWLDEPSAELLDLPVGTSYFPEWKPDELLRKDEIEIRSQNGSKYWQSLYMQDPVPDEGGLIKKEWFNVYKELEPPNCDFILQTYDTAFSTRTTADYSVIQTWGIFFKNTFDSGGVEYSVPNLILLSSKRDRLEYPELRSLAQKMYDKYKPDAVIVEKKASGQSLIQDLRRAGLPVIEYNPDKDKVARVNACTPILESGRVWIPENTSFADELVSEASSFPYAAHDDQVDAMSMAILYLRESWRVESPLDNYLLSEEELDNNNTKKSTTKRIGYWGF